MSAADSAVAASKNSYLSNEKNSFRVARKNRSEMGRRHAMKGTLARNAWGEIVHHKSDEILELRWLPTTMTDGAFKATLALFASQAERVRPSFLLIDATKFRHQFGPGVMQWRDDYIIPRYGAAGAQKFAFHVPADFPNTIESGGKEVFEGPAIFPTAWFSERQDALDWFRKGARPSQKAGSGRTP
jgi:hypothetical protein